MAERARGCWLRYGALCFRRPTSRLHCERGLFECYFDDLGGACLSLLAGTRSVAEGRQSARRPAGLVWALGGVIRGPVAKVGVAVGSGRPERVKIGQDLQVGKVLYQKVCFVSVGWYRTFS